MLVTHSEKSLTDAQLLALAKQGDSAAWQSLYERLLPSVWRAACARLNDRAAAEDIVSETFLALIRNLHSLEPESCSLHAWLFRVIQNKISDWARRHNCRLRVMEEISNSGDEMTDHDPADIVLTQEKRQLVVSVLENLRQDHRLVLELKYTEGMSVRDISGRIGQSEKSVESLLFRARAEFRQKYELQSKDTIAAAIISRGNQQ